MLLRYLQVTIFTINEVHVHLYVIVQYEFSVRHLKSRSFRVMVCTSTVAHCSSKTLLIDLQVPAPLNQYLRDYQREGIQFLYDHYKEGEGAVLGDDMGLGKTVQVRKGEVGQVKQYIREKQYRWVRDEIYDNGNSVRSSTRFYLYIYFFMFIQSCHCIFNKPRTKNTLCLILLILGYWIAGSTTWEKVQ